MVAREARSYREALIWSCGCLMVAREARLLRVAEARVGARFARDRQSHNARPRDPTTQA